MVIFNNQWHQGGMCFSNAWNLSYHFSNEVVKFIVVFCKHLNTNIPFSGGTGNITY